MDISSRKQLILTKIVALHTNSGDPVGSHLLQEYLDNLINDGTTCGNPDYVKPVETPAETEPAKSVG